MCEIWRKIKENEKKKSQKMYKNTPDRLVLRNTNMEAHVSVLFGQEIVLWNRAPREKEEGENVCPLLTVIRTR